MPTAYGRVYRPRKRTGINPSTEERLEGRADNPREERGELGKVFRGQGVKRSKNGRSLTEILAARTTPSSRARARENYGGPADVLPPRKRTTPIDRRRRIPKPGQNSSRRYF